MKRCLLFLVLLFLLPRTGHCADGFNNKSKAATNKSQSCKVGFKPTAASGIPKVIQRPGVRAQDPGADARTITLALGHFESTRYPQARSVADSAVHIASVLLSSWKFKDTLHTFTFTCENYNEDCDKYCRNCTDRIGGNVVLDKLFERNAVSLDLYLNRCRGEYGHSTENVNEIYSCRSVVFYDEPKLSPAYCYAYHIAHEYMHIIGFYHTDHVDDVAEQVGWIGWKILCQWRERGIDVMKIRPGTVFQ